MKSKRALIIFFCIIIICCSPKFDDKIASKVIGDAFGCSDLNRVSIKGISNDSSQTNIVIFRIKSGIDMSIIESSAKLRKFDKGWQLEGLQNKLGMYINPDDSIKEYRDLEISKLTDLEGIKATMKNMEFISEGIEKYIKANGYAPNCFHIDDLYSILVPKYSQEFNKEEDKWGISIYYFSEGVNDHLSAWIKKGIARKRGKSDYLLVSQGPGKDFGSGWEYNPDSPNAGIVSVKDLKEIYKMSFLLFNGKWIRAPKIEF